MGIPQAGHDLTVITDKASPPESDMIASSAFHGSQTTRLARSLFDLGSVPDLIGTGQPPFGCSVSCLMRSIAAANVFGRFGSDGACVFVMTAGTLWFRFLEVQFLGRLFCDWA
jgi:hypothetical protein